VHGLHPQHSSKTLFFPCFVNHSARLNPLYLSPRKEYNACMLELPEDLSDHVVAFDGSRLRQLPQSG
jgi:hypothetical protein